MTTLSTKNWCDAATIFNASGTSSLMPAANLLLPGLTQRARFIGFDEFTGGVTIDLDLGSTRPVSVAGVIGAWRDGVPPLGLGLEVFGGTQVDPEDPITWESLDYTVIDDCSRFGTYAFVKLAPSSFWKLFRFVVNCDYPPSGWLDLHRLWCGNGIEVPGGIDADYRMRLDDRSIVEAADSAYSSFTDRRDQSRVWAINNTLMPAPEAYGRTDGIMRAALAAGLSREVVLMVDDEPGPFDTDYFYDNSAYGRFTRLPETSADTIIYGSSCEFTETPTPRPIAV